MSQPSVLMSPSQLRPGVMGRRVRIGEALLGYVFLAVATWILVKAPSQKMEWVPAVICLLLLAVAANFRFDTPFGSTVATQVAFVPLMFVMPLRVVPLAVALAMIANAIPEMINGAPVGERVTRCLNSAWFTIGPVAVFALCEVRPFDASNHVLAAALLAQFVVNFLVALTRALLHGSGSFTELLKGSWVYPIDAVLYGLGLVVALAIRTDQAAPLALVPLLALLAVFGQERKNRVQSLVELTDAYEGTARVLGNVIEADDSYTGEHSMEVLQLCRDVGQRLGLSDERLRALEFGALLHDVGKVRVPKEIINKAGPLNEAEWRIIRTHPAEGQQLLDMVGGFMSTVGVIVRAHHERWDGKGYPDGLKGEAIPIEARIISCCDTWNAMRTDRSYRRALTFEAATRELQSVAGKQLDPKVVDTLLFVVRKDNVAAPHLSAVRLAANLVGLTADTPGAADYDAAGTGANPAVTDNYATAVPAINQAPSVVAAASALPAKSIGSGTPTVNSDPRTAPTPPARGRRRLHSALSRARARSTRAWSPADRSSGDGGKQNRPGQRAN